MDINYRNTAQIVSFAARLVAGDEYADIEGIVARGDVPSSVPRTGADPALEWCASWRDRNDRMIGRIREVIRDVGTGVGDVGVLCATRVGVQYVVQALRSAGCPVVLLEDYDGTPVEAVKVGTIKRAKGLEFKQVLIPDVRRDLVRSSAPPDGDAARERWDLARRELYVAMTRARDGLWVAVL